MPPYPEFWFSNQGTTAATSYGWPDSHEVDDILVLVTETNVTAGLTLPSTPSGMANTALSPRAQSSNVVTINSFWKRTALNASENLEPDAIVPATSNHQLGVSLYLRGCVKSGNFWNAQTSGGQSAGTSRTFSGFNTLTDDSLIMYMIAYDLDSGSSNLASITAPSGATNFYAYDWYTDAGNGGGLIIGFAEKATAGFVGNLTWTFSAASSWTGIALAIPPYVPPVNTDFEGWGVPL